MTLFRLALRNLTFHRRGNLAVLLGVAVGAAVLTGALLVGDGQRGSLRRLASEGLGWVEGALVSGRPVRQELADGLPGHAAPILLLRGTAVTDGSATAAPVPVTVLGVDERFWHPPAVRAGPTGFWDGVEAGTILSPEAARDLGDVPAGGIRLRLQKTTAVPRESLLGKRGPEDIATDVRLRVVGTLDSGAFPARFRLAPGAAPPRNVFVPLRALQQALGLEKRANALLTTDAGPNTVAEVGRRLTLDDWGLTVHDPEIRTQALFQRLDRRGDGRLPRGRWQNRLAETVATAVDRNGDGTLERGEVLDYYRVQRPFLTLESRQLLLEPAVVRAAEAAATAAGLRSAPTLVYLANRIAHGDQSIPYSVVAAVDAAQAPPLGPFLPAGSTPLADDEIVLAAWPESPLRARPGDPIRLTYYAPDDHSAAPKELTATFRLRGLVALRGPAADPELAPEFPGITDKVNIGEWEPPSSFDRVEIQKAVRKPDDDFWRAYRTVPKAYVSLATGQRLWGSRFGALTSVRLAPTAGGNLKEAGDRFRAALLRHLDPAAGGLVLEDVRQRGLTASAGSTDFGGLFLGFSFFLIAAALLLVGLLSRLNLERRASEVGLLLASGYSLGTVRRLLLSEAALIALGGTLLGLVGAYGFAALLLNLLGTWWPGGTAGSALRLRLTDVSLASLGLGFFGTLAVSLLTLRWALRGLHRLAPSALLRGETEPTADPARLDAPPRRSLTLAFVTAVAGVLLIVLGATYAPLARNHEAQAGTFFGGGALLLTAGLCMVWAWMRWSRRGAVSGRGTTALARLGTRNAARNPVRSLLTAGLTASAAFLIVAVESFRRGAGPDFAAEDGGSGGFAVVAETVLPLYTDPTSVKGHTALLDGVEARLNAAGAAPTEVRQRRAEAETLLRESVVMPLRVRGGEDASCLNLYQPQKPRLLGVPRRLLERGGFRFAATEATTADDRANPWRLVAREREDGAVPVFVEQNTAIWGLKKGLGDELEQPDEQGRPLRLRIVGLLKDSVFQSGLLLDEAALLRHYPGQEGYQLFLVTVPANRDDELTRLLRAGLADQGVEVTRSAELLALFLAVENTYLSTFQALGGLGLVLGALGLAVVLLRGAWERRGELALLRALGYRERTVGWLLLVENGFLLLLGLGAGTGAAALAVLPHRLGVADGLPWARLGLLLLGVALVGLAAGAAAVRSTVRAPLLPALRHE